MRRSIRQLDSSDVNFVSDSPLEALTPRKVTLAILIAVLLTANGCGNRSRPASGYIPPGQYIVESADDSLSALSVRAYGDGDIWYGLLNANMFLKDRSMFHLKIGDEVYIPPRDELDLSLPKSMFPDVLPADYVVMPGDSLHFIAKGCYGDNEQWIRI